MKRSDSGADDWADLAETGCFVVGLLAGFFGFVLGLACAVVVMVAVR